MPDNAAPHNNVWPGGPLQAAGLQTPQNSSITYVVYGDSPSVSELVPVLNQNCSAINAAAPGELSGNSTLQLHRDDSFALYAFNGTQEPQGDAFEACLNATIGNNLPASNAGRTFSAAHFACMVAVVVGCD